MRAVYPWTLLLKRFLLLLAFYQVFRLIFYMANLSAVAGEPFQSVAKAWLWGLRFDLWAVIWTMLPLLLLTFLPWRWQAQNYFQKMVMIYIAVVSFWNVGLNMIDVELYKFTGKRLTVEWLRLQQDLSHQGTGLVSYYWWLALASLGIWIILLKLWPKWRESSDASSFGQRVLFGLLILPFAFLGLRGGWQLKPLGMAHAYSLGSSGLGVLAMNSTFSFFRSGSQQFDSLQTRFFVQQEQERDSILRDHQSLKSAEFGRLKGYNVVLVIVESLAAEYMGALNDGKGYTPFLDELSQKGVLFRQNFANGRRSIEAVPSVVCGFPSLLEEALILSPYQGINMECLPQLLRKVGYSTQFFHGAYNGSMYFDAFALRSGFHSYFGFDEFARPHEDDGHWGAFDEPFFQYMAGELSQAQTPFFATIFTLSSHNPYHVPEKYKGRFPKGDLEIHESIGYADHSLQQFFESAASEPWFEKTIFVVTGDHTQKSGDKKYQSLTGSYRVPLLIYVPGVQLNADTEKVTQHADILPSVADLLGVEVEKVGPVGESVFAKGVGVAVNGNGYSYWMLRPPWLVEFTRATNEITASRFNLKTWQTEPAVSADADRLGAENLFKAILDSYNQALLTGRL